MNFIEYMIANQNQIFDLLLDHIQLTFLAVGCAILVGVPIGILICYLAKIKKPVMGLANLIQAIPSMALLGFAIPLLGIGNLPAIVVVTLYSLLPIIKNTVTGISNINKQTIEAARGIGLTKFQILYKIEIPLALPVIMAGVRISAVTAVGLMTMAAFIGGGGLGYLVFAGIRTVNNNQILAGAIPACILALTIDYFGAIVEYYLTPKALLPKGSRKTSKVKNVFQKVFIVLMSVIVLFSFVRDFNAEDTSNRQIVIGSKDFTEQVLLSEMLSQLIEENTDINVVRRLNLGGTQVAFGALRGNEIDLYVDYSGTAYADVLKLDPISDAKEVYDRVVVEYEDKFNIKVLEQMKFNNTYTFATTKEIASKYNLNTVSDLAKVSSDLITGTTLEFINREDGMIGAKRVYGLSFKEEIGLDSSSRYIALNNNEVDIIDAFATDGLLKKFNLKILEDDKKFFLPYYAIPLIREEAYNKYPEVVELINKLGKLLDNETMINLNYEVDENERTPEDVAKEFLRDKGLVK
ncbi:MAG: glycine betaine ABC transporter substrate-binding protein [Anaerorhabdus sp.]